jgi:hypothetical protein
MMMLAALLLMQGFTDIEPGKAATGPGPDIAVLEAKLGKWKGRWGYNDDKFVCETTQSSGDSAVDSVGCSALITCLGPEGQRLNAIAQGAGSDKDRADGIQAIVHKSAPCVAEKRHSGLIALAQLRGFTAAPAPGVAPVPQVRDDEKPDVKTDSRDDTR